MALILFLRRKGDILLLLLAMVTFCGLSLLTGLGLFLFFPGGYLVFLCALYRTTLITEGIIKEVDED